MAGYHNYSMSNNAVMAYNSGEKPLSKWTKENILAELQELGATDEHMALFRKMRLADLKETVLCKTSWHHTSSHYNATDFYSVEYDEDRIYTLPQLEKKTAPDEKLVYAHFLEWTGTKNYPKCTEHSRWGVVKGNSFYYISSNDIKTKRTTANGFNILEESGSAFTKEQLAKFLDKDYRKSLSKKKKLSFEDITGIALFYSDSFFKGNEIPCELVKMGFNNKQVVLLSKTINKYLDKEFSQIDVKQLNSSNLKSIREQISDKNTYTFFMDEYQNEIPAFNSIEALKKYIKEQNIRPDYDIHSGMFEGKRYYGCGGYGVRIDDLSALDNINKWWEKEYDSYIYSSPRIIINNNNIVTNNQNGKIR